MLNHIYKTKILLPKMKSNIKIIIFIFLFISSNLTAQTSFSCIYREYCTWNKVIEKYENCSGFEENSLFVINKNETMFTHTTEILKSTYYVDIKEYDNVKDVYTYDVTSDIGNKYYFVFDLKNKQIRVVFTKDGITKMIVYSVKAFF
jgi:hypothetical protein